MNISLAAPSSLAKREKNEPLHSYRNQFGRDRDRILYSKAFRRLSGKTQIFIPISHDHIRNRLTHTLEVAQISYVTSKNLNLNVDLSEAISLGHDIGHTPFGHIGERSLNMILNNCDQRLTPFPENMQNAEKGFKHNLHGLRVSCHLEKSNRNYPGMNLTNFTLWGIKNHSKLTWLKKSNDTGEILPCPYYKDGKCFFHLSEHNCKNKSWSVGFYDQYVKYSKFNDTEKEAWSFEGFVVAIADEIAQRHHDVEDAIFMEIVSLKEMKEKILELFSAHFDKEDKSNVRKLYKEKNQTYFLPLVSRFIINILNKNFIEHSKTNLVSFAKANSIKSNDDFLNNYPNLDISSAKSCIGFSADFKPAHDGFKDFLKQRVLDSYQVQRMDGSGTYVIRKLVKAYLTNPQQLSDATLVSIDNIDKRRTTGRKGIEDLTALEIGKIRSEISQLSKKSNKRFQINLLRGICDHIAGMTDNFATAEFRKLYGHL